MISIDRSGLPDLKYAPFSAHESFLARCYQQDGRYHPYRCDHGHESVPMNAEINGLKCPKCGIVQDWILQSTLELMRAKQ